MRSAKVQPILCRMTAPSLRTKRVVETPTLAVCGATGLPISAPTELSVGSSNGGNPRICPTRAWNFPNMAFVDVLLPDSATPIQPRMGATRMKAVPIFAKALASEAAMPEKLYTYAKPKMNTPTSMAPHICCQVLDQISASCRLVIRCSSATMSHETNIAVPPTNGVQLKTAVIVAPGVIEDTAATWRRRPLIAVRLDQGPVQATTTATRTPMGSQASTSSRSESPCAAACAPGGTGTPP